MTAEETGVHNGQYVLSSEAKEQGKRRRYISPSLWVMAIGPSTSGAHQGIKAALARIASLTS